jgi:hypothetical protein
VGAGNPDRIPLPLEEPGPHRTQVIRLNHALAPRLLDAHTAWLDDVEAEFGVRHSDDRS